MSEELDHETKEYTIGKSLEALGELTKSKEQTSESVQAETMKAVDHWVQTVEKMTGILAKMKAEGGGTVFGKRRKVRNTGT